MIYDFDVLPDRRNSESFKWNHFDADVLPMWVADMDFVSPEPVIRALHDRINHGVFGYAGILPGLREIIAERMDKLYGWDVAPDEVVLTPGVVTGINLAGHAFVNPGEGVIIHTPVYGPFLYMPGNVGGQRQLMELTLEPDGSYSIDWDYFENIISIHSRMFLMCNPHNPVGRVWTRAELERIAEICARHNLIICSDEIHCDLVYSGHSHIPIASLSKEISQRTITLMAPSKTFNIAGLSSSFAIIQNPEMRKQFTKADKGLVHGVNLLGMVAAKAAYQDGQEWLAQLLEYLESNRDFLYRYVLTEMPGIRMASPQGTYLAWLDCRNADIEGNPGDFFRDHARVAVNDGTGFGKGGAGFVRLNFGCPRAMLVDSLERMRKSLGT